MTTAVGTSEKEATITYSKNEKVLCFHGPLIYEAKILDHAKFDEKNSLSGYTGHHYLVHYKGWKSTWDEWVPWERLLKHNPENLEKQKEVLSKHTVQNTSTGAKAQKSGLGASHSAHGSVSARTGRKEAQGHGRGQKRGREEDDMKKPEMRLDCPESLKTVLTDDWEAITKLNMLVGLRSEMRPDIPTVVELLDAFTKYVIETKPPHLRDPPTIAPTIKAGLTTYFDKALGHSLLYRPERQQYGDVVKQIRTGRHVEVANLVEVSEIYGAMHLLRMLVQLPAMISQTTLDPESVGIVRDYTNELIAWLDRDRSKLFPNEPSPGRTMYHGVTQGYINEGKT